MRNGRRVVFKMAAILLGVAITVVASTSQAVTINIIYPEVAGETKKGFDDRRVFRGTTTLGTEHLIERPHLTAVGVLACLVEHTN